MVVHQNITNLAGYFHFLNVRKIPYVIHVPPVTLFYVVYLMGEHRSEAWVTFLSQATQIRAYQIRPFVFTLPHQAADCPYESPQGSAHHPE